MDLSGDLFDILPRCFNMDTLVQCLAGRCVISDAEDSGQIELELLVRLARVDPLLLVGVRTHPIHRTNGTQQYN